MYHSSSNGSVEIGRVYSDCGAYAGNNSIEVSVTARGNIVISTGYEDKHRVAVSKENTQEVIDMLSKAIELSDDMRSLYTEIQTLKQTRMSEILGAHE